VTRPSRKAFEEYIVGFYKDVVKLEGTLEEGRVFPLSPDVALAMGVFRYTARTTSGDTIGGRNAFSYVYVKRGESWRIKHAHESTVVAEA
jgi:hypothetical protein